MQTVCEPIEIVLTGAAWEAGLRPLLLEPGGWAVGELRRQELSSGFRLLADHLEPVHTLPRGASRPALSDWLVLHVASDEHDPAWSAVGLIEEVAPRASQGLAAVVVRRRRKTDSNDARADLPMPTWDAAWFDAGHITSVAALQVVGPGMLHLERQVAAGLLGATHQVAQLRWSRTIGALGPSVVGKLRQARVTIVGASRGASQAAGQLAALGVSLVRLVDHDVLKLENLDAMPGMSAADVGRPKVEALARRLLEFRPDLAVTCLARSITDGTVLAELRRLPADLIVTAVDQDAARLAASLLARDTLTPHLDLGTSIRREESGELLLTGDARLLLPGAGCVACVGGLASREESLYELAAPPETLRRGTPQAWDQQRAGSLVTLNSLTVGAGVQLWLDLLARNLRTSYWQRLRWVPGWGLEANAGPVGAADDCLFCRGG